MVERADRATVGTPIGTLVGTFYAPGEWGATVELDEAAAHHANVKRLEVGNLVRLTSGDGRRAIGTIAALGKRVLSISLEERSVETVPPMPWIELWTPVGDRERMLTLAEKAVELGASAWRPVIYRRSRSVTPRGEGQAFREKVRLRMIAALEQSGSAWLPHAHAEVTFESVLGTVNGIDRLLLDPGGRPLASLLSTLRPPLAVAFGPEGGLEPAECEGFLAAGWRAASLGANVLRFETAGIVALALIRSLTP
jgi:16S rRNA (uracil1498-N3)-methyltransferase